MACLLKCQSSPWSLNPTNHRCFFISHRRNIYRDFHIFFPISFPVNPHSGNRFLHVYNSGRFSASPTCSAMALEFLCCRTCAGVPEQQFPQSRNPWQFPVSWCPDIIITEIITFRETASIIHGRFLHKIIDCFKLVRLWHMFFKRFSVHKER